MKRGNYYNRFNEKAVSPIVATSILIVIVIILATIILFWSRGFVDEVVTKEVGGDEKTAEAYCRELSMRGFVNQDNTFGFENGGNVPIFAYKIKTEKGGSSDSVLIPNNAGGSVNPGFSVIIEDSRIGLYTDYDSVKIIPIILGNKGIDNVEFECPEINGIEI